MLRNRCIGRLFYIYTAFYLLTSFGIASAKTYYVGPSGNDNNNGLTTATPFLDIQAAANLTVPGDTVMVMTGTYAADPNIWHNAVLSITRSGTAKQPITFEAYPGAQPVITTAGNPKVWEAVQIAASYIDFISFEVVGNAQQVTLAGATATAAAEDSAFLQSQAAHAADPSVPVVYPSDVATNGNCVSVEAAKHVKIIRSIVHDCSASGIVASSSDYVTIRGNVVFNTSWWSVYDTSGIALWRSVNSDFVSGYHNYILNNVSHDNGNTQAYYNSAYGNGVPTDGNGIIIDSNLMPLSGAPYQGRTLIMGNVVYNNGGSGMHTYLSAHVDMYDNTGYMNNNCPVQDSVCGNISEGQILADMSNDVNIYNNVMSGPAAKRIYSDWGNTAVSEDYNVFYAQGQTLTFGADCTLDSHDIVAEPAFNYLRS